MRIFNLPPASVACPQNAQNNSETVKQFFPKSVLYLLVKYAEKYIIHFRMISYKIKL